MTREDAIKTLKELWQETNDSWYEEVYSMAINALETDRKTEPQTDIHGLTDCDFCKEKNCEDCEGGKDEPQAEVSAQEYERWLFEELRTIRDENYIYAYDKTHGEWYPIQEIDRPCDNCQERDCYGCDYKQVKRSDK